MRVSIISLHNLIGTTLNTRDEAKIVAKEIESFFQLNLRRKKIILDCGNVIFMSRSFADEFYKAKVSLFEKYKGIISLVNADEQLLEILHAVSLTQNDVVKKEVEYTYIAFNDMEKLYAHLLSY